ncbi:hypothetical protein COCNU_06G005740 [Cocos nucifera]|uniref:Uncharacterized protein n=1 Tax=Cocos nucifera TaxID=13894 RepID=A0A8K0IB78_COCNU|nr:hypothetical protein COCNU_06G005740 [Cocos nucifera]
MILSSHILFGSPNSFRMNIRQSFSTLHPAPSGSVSDGCDHYYQSIAGDSDPLSGGDGCHHQSATGGATGGASLRD